MSYTTVDTVARATRAAGDVLGRVGVGLLKKAAIQANASPGGQTSKLEAAVCRAIIDGSAPVSFTTTVLYFLDTVGALTTNTDAATPTDAQVNTAVDSAWVYFLASRTLTGG